MPLRAREADDVVDGEKIRRVFALGDQSEFVREAFAHGVIDAVGVALFGALPCEMHERVLRRGEACARLVGIFVFQFVEREGERGGKLQRLRDRLRRVAEQPRHLGRRLEMALGIDGEPAAGRVDGQVLADAGEHVLQFAPVGMVIEHVVDGDQRHAGMARKLGAAEKPRAVVAAIEHGGGEPHAAGRGVAQAGKEVLLLGFVFPSSDHAQL